MTKTEANATFVKTVNGTAPTNGNVAINDYVTSLSINGNTITVNKKDGTSDNVSITTGATYSVTGSPVSYGNVTSVRPSATGLLTGTFSLGDWGTADIKIGNTVMYTVGQNSDHIHGTRRAFFAVLVESRDTITFSTTANDVKLIALVLR